MHNSEIVHTPHYIIIADDDIDDQELLQAALCELNFPLRINTVNDGVELLEHLDSSQEIKSGAYPSLIVLDINMPKKNGMEVLKELKKNPVYESIPVIMYSTSQNEDTQAKCYLLGAHSYIRKPISQKELRDVASSIKNVWSTIGKTSLV